MKTVLQTNFNGIDGLSIEDTAKPTLTDNGVLVKMAVMPVSPTDWKLESDAHATNEDLATLPRVIGIQGAGTVIAVGKNRDQALLNRRVLVVNPAGVYQEVVLSENPDWLYPLAANVSNADAAALSAGTSWTLKQAIDHSHADNIVITSANSVIGLTLLQMLADEHRPIYPIVTEASKTYFASQMPHLTAYTNADLPTLTGTTIVLDIVGKLDLLTDLAARLNQPEIVSIVLMQAPTLANFKFVHDEFNADHYRYFLQTLADGKLTAIINKIFPIDQTKEAQHFAKETHSRGRVLVGFTA
ncbi:hypothetical protein AYR62_05380 [Secundilactobacillus paracollinoides]|uniref:quinone oxidoreductase family protein n=1 Tax=Secundilactobacillus paracollinoides TaxID=240427 RepID=UPI00081AAF4D|nr:zinc-binding alcohol dehydrogenase family protein [Secundilactobacillus paracollinoides]ANZ63579.1 hypothetical protein AYR62_05380 [Secundilactobacillus paracollinoides]